MWPKKIQNYLQLVLFIGCFFSFNITNAQSIPKGISYQALLNDEAGDPMRNSTVRLRIILTNDADQSKIFYVENQQVQTDDQGILNMIIGQEANGQDLLKRVPWSEESIWMNIELLNDDGTFKLINQGSFLAVPYAFHAGSANRIIPQDTALLRTNQSIIWNASGNFKTQPHVHYLGTADEKALYFKTNNTTRMVISAEGQTTYYTDPGLDGGDTDKDSYPIVIQDGRQGIYIEIQESRSTANNFLTFADTEGIHGTVEGQTAAEYYLSFDYLFPFGIKLFDIGVEVANGIAGAIEGGGLAAALNPATAVKFAFLVEIASSIAIQTVQLIAWQVEVALAIGVSYTTGGADYAEWIEKERIEEVYRAGEIVGIHNGKVSHETADADHLMVISLNPSVLGNMPEKAAEYKYEKVAFKGQVKTYVVGSVNLGDYILPSGNDDGMGIAISPEDMKTGDYNRIIGVAWEEASEGPINLVNVAVGINTNDLSSRLEEVEGKLGLITDYLGGQAQLVDGKITSMNGVVSTEVMKSKMAEMTKLAPFLSDEAYEQFFDENAEYYEEAFDLAGEYLEEMGIDLAKHPEIKAVYDDPVSFYKSMRKDPKMATYMGYFDQNVLDNNSTGNAGKDE
ncbi:MAG: hypothetical protein Sapg2KO_52420 [Saprospiraceae bacterium]